MMGSPEEEAESYDFEKPQHQVTVKPFFIGKYPITQAQWQAVAKLPKIHYDLESNPSHFKDANRPVENVSWYDAIEFCARLSQKTGKIYRLPSEAEWEYACRARTTTPFHFGETITTDLANYDGNYIYADEPKSKSVYRKETTPVGSFGVANAFGLYDMHGNVWEWCADVWHSDYQGAPDDGTVWDENWNDNLYQSGIDLLVNTKDDNRTRLLRGGSCYDIPRCCRSAIRNNNSAPDDRGNDVGFRVACVPART
jgi:formylglycine-generating enzyme required for sulfatase activity